jgi:hypothetical protein
VIGGVEQRIHFLAVDLPHSDACFARAYPAETTEALCDGHNATFAFFGRVPQSMLYDTPGRWWRAFWVMAHGSAPGFLPSCSPTTYSPIASATRARAMTKVRWRGWSADRRRRGALAG